MVKKHKINGISYIELEHLLTETSGKEAKRFIKMGIIVKKIKEIKRGGFFSSGYAIIQILVPEKKIKEYQKMSI